MLTTADIAHLIDTSPMNRGTVGAAWLLTPGNFAFASPAGDVFLFERRGYFYEFHWLCTVSKPRDLIKFTREAFREIYDIPDIAVIYGLIPGDRRDSKFMARWMGARPMGQVSTTHGPCELFILARTDLEKD